MKVKVFDELMEAFKDIREQEERVGKYRENGILKDEIVLEDTIQIELKGAE